MSAFDPHSWYILTNLQPVNDTLTAASNSQAAFDPNSPSGIYYAPVAQSVSDSQLWQLYPVNTSSATAYIFRNRAIGPNAYLSAAWSTRKCGGGQCATVPVLSPGLVAQSLWNFGAWGFSDPTGGAFIYNYGNGSDWRLDTILEGGPESELLNYLDTRRMGAHWSVSSYATFATNEATGFLAVPTAASSVLAQATGATADATFAPYTAVGTVTRGSGTGTSSTNSPANTNGTTNDAQNGSAGLSTGAIAGLAVGLVVLIAGLLAVGFLLYRRRKQSRKTALSPDASTVRGSAGHGAASKFANKQALYSEMESPPAQHYPLLQDRTEMQHPSEHPRSEIAGTHAPWANARPPMTSAELSGSPAMQHNPHHPESWSTNTNSNSKTTYTSELSADSRSQR